MAVPTAVMAALPEAARASDAEPGEAEPMERDALLEGVRVLIVDDDEESRAIVAEYLACHQASVTTAASAAEAFERLQRDPPDVMLADIAMPGEDGYMLIRKLRASPSSALASIPAAALAKAHTT